MHIIIYIKLLIIIIIIIIKHSKYKLYANALTYHFLAVYVSRLEMVSGQL